MHVMGSQVATESQSATKKRKIKFISKT